MTMNTKSTAPQFMVLASTGVAPGKSVKMKMESSQHRAAILTAMPQRPSDHGRGGSSSLRTRLMTRQMMQSMYEPSKLAQLRDRIAFKATEDPMLMSASKLVHMREMSTALTGTFNVGCT